MSLPLSTVSRPILLAKRTSASGLGKQKTLEVKKINNQAVKTCKTEVQKLIRQKSVYC